MLVYQLKPPMIILIILGIYVLTCFDLFPSGSQNGVVQVAAKYAARVGSCGETLAESTGETTTADLVSSDSIPLPSGKLT